MKKTIYFALIVAAVIALFFLLKTKPVQVEVHKVRSGEFQEKLSVEGIVRSRTKQTIYAFANGEVQNLSVKVGDLVKKDQELTRLQWEKLMIVRSPMNGVVSKVFRESAGPILRGEPIVEVSSLNDLEIVAQVLTPDAVRLDPNTEVLIQNWGGEGDLKARVEQVSRAGSTQISALGVEEEKTEVRARFEQIPEILKNKLGDKYHVDVVFLLSNVNDVLTVPLGALFKISDDWAVATVQNGKAHFQVIKISKRNVKEAVVESGLNSGDEVILYPGDKIQEGTLVSVKP